MLPHYLCINALTIIRSILIALFVTVVFMLLGCTNDRNNPQVTVSEEHQISSVPIDSAAKVEARDFIDRSKAMASANADSSLSLALLAFDLAQQSGDLQTLEDAYHARALAYEYAGLLDSALNYYDLGQVIAKQRNDSLLISGYDVAKGLACYYSGEYGKAVYWFDQALVTIRERKDLTSESKVLNNLAIVYKMRNDYTQAINMYRRSIEIKELLNDKDGVARSRFNLAKAHYMADENEEAETEFFAARAHAIAVGDSMFVDEIDAEIGINAIDFGDYERAEIYLTQSFQRLLDARNPSVISVLVGLAIIDNHNGRFEQAYERLQMGYEALKNSRGDKIRQEYEKQLAIASEAAGNYREALEHHKMYTELKLEEFLERRERLAEEMQTRYQTREKESRILLQEFQLADASRSRRQLVLVTSFIALLLIGAALLAFLQNRNNRLLTAEKAKTEAALRDRETLLREIHHRVKNNLQVVSSLLSIQGREISDEKALKAVNESRNRVHSMALIHQFLYGEEHLSSIDMQEYVDELASGLMATYRVGHDKVKLTTRVTPMRLDVDTAIPVGLILNELITNALKYAFPDQRQGNITVELYERNEKLYLVVSDDGIGASGDQPKSSSFGMKLLNAFKTKLQGDFSISGNPGMTVTYVIGKYQVV